MNQDPLKFPPLSALWTPHTDRMPTFPKLLEEGDYFRYLNLVYQKSAGRLPRPEVELEILINTLSDRDADYSAHGYWHDLMHSLIAHNQDREQDYEKYCVSLAYQRLKPNEKLRVMGNILVQMRKNHRANDDSRLLNVWENWRQRFNSIDIREQHHFIQKNLAIIIDILHIMLELGDKNTKTLLITVLSQYIYSVDRNHQLLYQLILFAAKCENHWKGHWLLLNRRSFKIITRSDWRNRSDDDDLPMRLVHTNDKAVDDHHKSGFWLLPSAILKQIDGICKESLDLDVVSRVAPELVFHVAVEYVETERAVESLRYDPIETRGLVRRNDVLNILCRLSRACQIDTGTTQPAVTRLDMVIPEHDKKILERLPIAVVVSIVNQGYLDLEPVKRLFQRMDQLNATLEEGLQLPTAFLIEHIVSLVFLYENFGMEIFDKMTSLLQPTPGKLDRVLSGVRVLPQRYVTLLKPLLSWCTAQNAARWFEILALMTNVELLLLERDMRKIKPESIIDQYEHALTEVDQNLDAYLKAVIQIASQVYQVKLNVTTFSLAEENITGSLKLLPLLLVGRSKLTVTYREIFDRMIREDFTEGGNFDRLILDHDQTDQLGASVARHNLKISYFLDPHIDTDSIMMYTRTKSFATMERGNPDYCQLCESIWHHIQALDKLGEHSLKSFIENTRNIVSVSKDVNEASRLQHPSFEKVFESALPELQKLISSPEILEKDPQIAERASHIVQDVTRLFDGLKGTQRNFKMSLFSHRSFTVKQWDKRDKRTLALGRYLDCCLDPARERFDAMVERRLDLGMPIHVVVDSHDKPVAGVWLFLAFCDKQIVLGANFVNAHPKIAEKSALCTRIVEELLRFSAQFAADINATAFLICPLRYGNIPDFKDKFPLVKVKLQKVGGCFGQDGYYLDALHETTFYSHPLPQPTSGLGDHFDLDEGCIATNSPFRIV